MEILDICDELGNPTGKTVEREIAHQQGILHRTAHVWILRKKENKINHCIYIEELDIVKKYLRVQ